MVIITQPRTGMMPIATWDLRKKKRHHSGWPEGRDYDAWLSLPLSGRSCYSSQFLECCWIGACQVFLRLILLAGDHLSGDHQVSSSFQLLLSFLIRIFSLASLWTEDDPEEQGRQRAARQLSALTVTDSQGKRKFVTDPSRTTFTRRNVKQGGGRVTGIQMEGGIGVRGENDIPEEIAGEKVEGRMKPLVERAALARRRRR